MIHPTAVVHPKARIDPSVTVGPYAIIDEHVEIGPGCRVGPYVLVTGHSVIGAHNQFYAGAVVGEAPQDLKYRGAPSRLRVGDHNTFREHCTVHRSNKAEDETVIGSHNLLMASCHVAHDCRLGDYNILANGALLGGHVVVGHRALISGNCLVHQFVRVGTLAMMQGGSAISKDLPPYTVARGHNGMSGLNTIGLRRAGISALQRLELRKLYHLLFRSGKKVSEALAEAAPFQGDCAKALVEFVASAKRGICRDKSVGGTSTDDDEEAEA